METLGIYINACFSTLQQSALVVSLTQPLVTRGETLPEELFKSDWPVAMSVGDFLNCLLM